MALCMSALRQAGNLINVGGIPGGAKHGGCSIHETVLRFHETERPVRTASVNQVRQPIYRTSAGRWREHAVHLQPLLAALRVRSA
jgi:hypothetical protein